MEKKTLEQIAALLSVAQENLEKAQDLLDNLMENGEEPETKSKPDTPTPDG